jgi:hypothetical protein
VEYLSEWKITECAQRQFTTTTSEPTRAFADYVTSLHCRPASTTGSTTKITTTFKTQQMKSDYKQTPRSVNPYPQNNSSVTRKTWEFPSNTTHTISNTY